jgi:hypothetical protein
MTFTSHNLEKSDTFIHGQRNKTGNVQRNATFRCVRVTIAAVEKQ